jgi:hypothetical protein
MRGGGRCTRMQDHSESPSWPPATAIIRRRIRKSHSPPTHNATNLARIHHPLSIVVVIVPCTNPLSCDAPAIGSPDSARMGLMQFPSLHFLGIDRSNSLTVSHTPSSPERRLEGEDVSEWKFRGYTDVRRMACRRTCEILHHAIRNLTRLTRQPSLGRIHQPCMRADRTTADYGHACHMPNRLRSCKTLLAFLGQEKGSERRVPDRSEHVRRSSRDASEQNNDNDRQSLQRTEYVDFSLRRAYVPFVRIRAV